MRRPKIIKTAARKGVGPIIAVTILEYRHLALKAEGRQTVDGLLQLEGISTGDIHAAP